MVKWSNNKLSMLLQSGSLILLLCLLLPFSIYAQGGFSKRYTNNASQSNYQSCVAVGKGMNVLVAATRVDSTTGKQLLQIRKIGPDGKELVSGDPFYWNPDSFFYFFPYHCGTRLNDTEYVWLLNQDVGGRHPYLLVTDSNGHITRQRALYSDRCYPTDDRFFSAYAITVDPYGAILIGAYKDCGSVHSIQMLVKLNRTLDVIWEHTYDLFHYERSLILNIFADSSGYTLLGGSTQGAEHFKTFACESGIIRTDTAGNYLWIYTTPTGKRRSMISHSAQLADGGCSFMVMEITKDRTPEGPNADWMGVEQLINVDASGHEKWIRSLSPDTSYFGSIMQEGCSIGYKDSTLLIHIYESPTNTNLLQRYDLRGRLMSQRTLLLEDTSLGRFGLLSNWLILPDGSLFGSGEFPNYINPAYPMYQGLAIRLDSNLCLVPAPGGCMEPVSVREQRVLSRVPFHLYPNPVYEKLQLESAGRIEEFAVMDLQGRTCMTQKCNSPSLQIQTNTLVPGVYMIRLQIADGTTEVAKFIKR